MNTLRKRKTLRCSGIGVALSLLLFPVASSASNLLSVVQPAEMNHAMIVSANETVFYFKASLKDGSEFLYPFAERPILRNQRATLILTTTKEVVKFPEGAVLKFTLVKGDETTGIEGVSGKAQMERSGNILTFSNCKVGTEICVYNQGGQKVLSSQVSGSGVGSVSLQQLPQGVYIVKSGSVTCKILKK